MSLEAKIDELIAVVKENTAAVRAAGGAAGAAAPAATEGKRGPGRPPKADAPKVPTAEEAAAAAEKVIKAKGKPAVRKLVTDVGKAEKLAEIAEGNRAAFIAACEALLAGGETEAEDDDDI